MHPYLIPAGKPDPFWEDSILVENATGAGYNDPNTGLPDQGSGPDTPIMVFRDGPRRKFIVNITIVGGAGYSLSGSNIFSGELMGSCDRINWFNIGAIGFQPANFWSGTFTSGIPATMIKIGGVYNFIQGNGYTIRVLASGG
jgi:hypothetical protein